MLIINTMKLTTARLLFFTLLFVILGLIYFLVTNNRTTPKDSPVYIDKLIIKTDNPQPAGNNIVP